MEDEIGNKIEIENEIETENEIENKMEDGIEGAPQSVRPVG
jgi:hypothetical protein